MKSSRMEKLLQVSGSERYRLRGPQEGGEWGASWMSAPPNPAQVRMHVPPAVAGSCLESPGGSLLGLALAQECFTAPRVDSWAPFFFFFLGSHPQHMEVPRLGIESELQLPASTSATAMQNPSRIFDPRQCWILNPLIEARDRTCILMDVRLVSTEPEGELPFFCLFVCFFTNHSIAFQ